jgi:epoxide hydrolase 4
VTLRRFDIALAHGITLACRADGPAERAPRVLLLHGFPEAAFVWDEPMALLAGDVGCVAPNLRGFAGSSAPADVAAYRAKHLVADIAALIEHFGAPIDLLVAHDWGGACAWNLAALRPDLLKRLLIVNSPHPATFLRELRESPEQQAASAYMNFLCRPDAAALLRENGYARLSKFFGGAAWDSPEVQAKYHAVWDQSLETSLNYYRASPLRPPLAADDPIHTLDLPDELVNVNVPTTVLWGDGDIALLPGLLRGLDHWVPNIDVRRVPDATHWIVHEKPALVAETIRSLL